MSINFYFYSFCDPFNKNNNAICDELDWTTDTSLTYREPKRPPPLPNPLERKIKRKKKRQRGYQNTDMSLFKGKHLSKWTFRHFDKFMQTLTQEEKDEHAGVIRFVKRKITNRLAYEKGK